MELERAAKQVVSLVEPEPAGLAELVAPLAMQAPAVVVRVAMAAAELAHSCELGSQAPARG